MTLIKEHVFLGKTVRVIVRTNTYADSFAHIAMLTEELKKDFQVKDEDIDIVKYGGERYKGALGVECSVPLGTQTPASYKERDQVELTI